MKAAIQGTSHLRWHLKKAARKSFALSAWCSGSLTMSLSNGTHTCRVLTYHRVADEPRDPFSVTPREFAKQMAFLAENHLAVSLADVESFVRDGRPLANGTVLVTIDDGFRSVYKHALPVLKSFGIPAIAFITPSLIDPGNTIAETQSLSAPEPYLSWEEVKELADNNVAIGSHAWTHRSLGTLAADEAEIEAMRSKDTLEHQLQQPVTSFAYPFGTKADFNATTTNILRRTGYTLAFTSQHGAIRSGADALVLPRVKVEGGENMWLFKLLLRGGLDAWRFVDQTLWRLQARQNG